MLDRKLVEDKISELDNLGGKWTIDKDLTVFSVVALEKTNTNAISISQNNVVPLAVFANNTTGEIKLFDARTFGFTA